jgi:putative flippase GtrA
MPDEAALSPRKLLTAHLGRFVVVGLSNLALSYAVFTGCLWLLVGFAARGTFSQLVTYTVGTLWSYYWNRRWTFRSQQAIAGEASRFVAVQIGCALVSTALIGLSVDWLKLHASLSWVIVMGFITLLNFTLLKLWAFRGASA